MFCRVNGRQLYIEVSGPQSGPAVVLLHHGLGSTLSWAAQAPALVEAGCRVIVYDRWGYGRSEPRPRLSAPYFDEDLQDLHALLAELGGGRAALVGHSDGGTIALYYAARRPEQVVCLVAVAAHVYVEPKMQPGIEGVRAAYQSQPRFREGLQRLHGQQTEAVFNNWFNSWTASEANLAWDMRPLLGRIACPALVVQGMEDEHATPQHARHIASIIPGAQLWLAPDSAHMLPQEKAPEFNRRLLAFLREHLNLQPASAA